MNTVIATVLEVMVPLLALILDEPGVCVVSKPVLSIVATAVSLEDQLSPPNVAGVPSVKVPVAMNCWVVPKAKLADATEMANEASAGSVTFNNALLEVMPLNEAEMVVLPCNRAEAMPLEFNVATVVSLDSHVTEPETSLELPSEKLPVAANVTLVPLGVETTVGLMLMPVMTAVVTVRFAGVEEMLLLVAVIVVVPTPIPAAIPERVSIDAMPVSAEAHVTWLEMSAVEPSEYVPVAVKCTVSPMLTAVVGGEISILASVGDGLELLPLPQPEIMRAVMRSKAVQYIYAALKRVRRCMKYSLCNRQVIFMWNFTLHDINLSGI